MLEHAAVLLLEARPRALSLRSDYPGSMLDGIGELLPPRPERTPSGTALARRCNGYGRPAPCRGNATAIRPLFETISPPGCEPRAKSSSFRRIEIDQVNAAGIFVGHHRQRPPLRAREGDLRAGARQRGDFGLAPHAAHGGPGLYAGVSRWGGLTPEPQPADGCAVAVPGQRTKQ